MAHSSLRVSNPLSHKRVANHSGQRPIRVLIVNGSGLMGNAMASLFHSEPGFEIIRVVKCCADCCQSVSDLAPDVVLCDLDTEEECGSRSLDRFRSCLPDVPTIVLSSNDHEQRILRVVRVGVQGFLTKDTSPEILFKAIRTVSKGGCYLDAEVQSKIMTLFGNSRNKRDPYCHLLTERERQILRLMANGLTNDQIAREVCLSTSAVKYHNGAIFKKLGVSNRAEAVRIATQQALLS